MNEVAQRQEAPAQGAISTTPEAGENKGLPNVLTTGAALFVTSSILAACSGGGSDAPAAGLSPAPTPTQSPSPAPSPAVSSYQFKSAQSDDEAAALLQQAQFSSTSAEIAAVRSGNYSDWLDQQMAVPLSDTAWDWLDRRGYYNVDPVALTAPFDPSFFNATYPADFALWRKLISAPDAMRQRAALALSELFVVSLTAAGTWNTFGHAHWWDMLCANAFGDFRTLLEEVTLNPMMGAWLNTKGNKKENASGRVPDENYAREVMQLFTIGLYKLNIDGTVVTDVNGKAVDSYTQDDVTNLARVFTGYDFDTSDNVRYTITRNDGTTFKVASRDYVRKKMSFNAAEHSTLAKQFLGTSIPANTTGPVSLKTALDTLANHPNVGPFFGKQMIQRLVTSNPSANYVRRVAEAFNNNGAGVRGDLKAVWRAILLDDEARDPQNKTSPSFGKLREPMVRMIQWGRSFGYTSAAGSWKHPETTSTSSRLGQSPLRSPSVFNFFRPGFVPPSTQFAVSKSVAPEFQITNETTVAAYLNYMQTLIRSGTSVREPALPQSVATGTPVADMVAKYTDELALVTDSAALVAHLNKVLCAGRLTGGNLTIIKTALDGTSVTAASTEAAKLDRIAAGVLLVMASSDYLIQR